MRAAGPSLRGVKALAWMAALLLALAPSLSRWEQSRVAMPGGMAMADCAGHLSPHRSADPVPSELAHDHQDGDPCAYCGLAALLLPGAMVWLVVPQQDGRIVLQAARPVARWTAQRWRGLGARGPPEIRW